MRTHNICLYKKVNKMYTGCNLKTTEFHECALIGVCAIIRSNTVCEYSLLPRAIWVFVDSIGQRALFMNYASHVQTQDGNGKELCK